MSVSGAVQKEIGTAAPSGPYAAIVRDGKKVIEYLGNRIFPALADVSHHELSENLLLRRLQSIVQEERFVCLHRIDRSMFNAVVQYFRGLGADWCNLPLTTLMISSPGEVYAGKTLNYTTDTLPVTLSWFENERGCFLAESSQFYLELRLLLSGVDKVFCLYNSFRKERADASHLSEFQHIEFEGKVDFAENIHIAENLIRAMVFEAVNREEASLRFFLGDDGPRALAASVASDRFETLTFKEALKLLYKDTGNPHYLEFSLRHFGAWEEVRLTEIVGRHVWLTAFPLLEIPFYHNRLSSHGDEPALAENADLIMYGYREVIGSGVRIADRQLLAEKARVFNLPAMDYAPYLSTREFEHYTQTAGFGLGWQRFVHWMLRLPAIWEATHVPRTHFMPVP